MNNTSKKTPSDPWKVWPLLIFGSATAVCLYIGDSFRSYYLLLGLCMFGLFLGIIYLFFIPSDDDEGISDSRSGIRSSGEMTWRERPPFVQTVVFFGCIGFLLFCVACVLVILFPDAECTNALLASMRSVVTSIVP